MPGSSGGSQLLEQQHEQADGPCDEDNPPDQQGGDGPQTPRLRSHRRVIYLIFCLEISVMICKSYE